MSRITITIDTDNAAFEDCMESEVARILTELSADIQRCGIVYRGPVRDINGNTVGAVKVSR